MVTTVAINGFGRIGRCVLRALIESGRDDVEVVAVNDLAPPETSGHLLQFDSVHGVLREEVKVKGDVLEVAGRSLRITSERNPEALPWDGVDVALECTGIFKARKDAARYLENGAGKVLVSAPGKDMDRTVVFGVNHHDLSAEDRIVSNASCTTNCLAPVAQVLDESFGIETGYMTTIHSYTGDQPVLDTAHSDLYRARAAALSMIPTTTGAAVAVAEVLPQLAGRLDGSAIRVPTPNVSCVDLCVMLSKPADAGAVNAAMAEAANGRLKGVLGVEGRKLVSSDYNHNPLSSVFASDQTRFTDGGMLRVVSWYDNEWGFSNRMLDTAGAMGVSA